MAKGLPFVGGAIYLPHWADSPVLPTRQEQWDGVTRLPHFPETTCPPLGICGSSLRGETGTPSGPTGAGRKSKLGTGMEE